MEYMSQAFSLQCRSPCRPPRAAHSHSSSVGSLSPFHLQKAWASFQLTWTTGKSRRSRMPEPGPAGLKSERSREWDAVKFGDLNRHEETCLKLTCLQNTRSTGNHQGADWMGGQKFNVKSSYCENCDALLAYNSFQSHSTSILWVTLLFSSSDTKSWNTKLQPNVSASVLYFCALTKSLWRTIIIIINNV